MPAAWPGTSSATQTFASCWVTTSCAALLWRTWQRSSTRDPTARARSSTRSLTPSASAWPSSGPTVRSAASRGSRSSRRATASPSARRRSARDRALVGAGFGPPPARDRRGRLHRLLLRAPVAGGGPEPDGHRPRQAHLRRAPGQPCASRVGLGHGPPPALRAGRCRRRGGRRSARGRGGRRRELRRRVPRGPLAPRSGSLPAHGCHGRARLARGVSEGDRPGTARGATGAAALPPGLHRRGLRVGRGGPLARGGPARPPVPPRGPNTYGPYQHPEKLVPLFVTNAIDDQPLPLYGDGLQRRDWLYVTDPAAPIHPPP